MGIMDALRRAGQQGKSVARRGLDWGRHEAEDRQSAARRKWRVNRPGEVAQDERAEKASREIERRAIVSVNAQDVSHLNVRERAGEEPQEVDQDPPKEDAA